MTSEFDRDIATTPRSDGDFDAELAAGWTVGGGLNGGYLMSIMGAAAQRALAERGHPDPFAFSAHFLSPAAPGPAKVEVQVLRSGGRFSTAQLTLVQHIDGTRVPRIAAQATFGDLDRAHDQGTDEAAAALGLSLPAPALPPLEECVSTADAPEEVRRMAPLLERFATRFDPSTAGWAVGEPSRRGLLQGWFALADHRPLDPIALLMVVDALPPTTFDLGMPGWAPTLELTAHVRAKPAPGWAIARHRTRTVAGGLFEEDCDIWDSTGRLVAQARQLALQPRG